MRAAHQLLDHPRILEDAVVLRLIGAEQEAALRANLQVLDRPELRPLRVSIAVRSRYAEDALREAVRRGVRQYVILGAGLDSFAYRNPFPPADLHVYEVDHPDTQTWKRQKLRDAGIELPQSLTFIPVDFERQTLADAMATGGFNSSQPAFVSWLGVTAYLTRETVMDTLGYVASLAPGSEIVFSYVVPLSSLPEPARAARSNLAAYVAAGGEPWLTFFEPAALAVEIRGLGFARVEDFGPEQIFARYLQGRSDGLREEGATQLMKATLASGASKSLARPRRPG